MGVKGLNQTAFLGGVWAVLSFLLGGIDPPLTGLAALVVIDFITGVYAAIVRRRLSSALCSRGIFKKFMVFITVIVATMLDMTTSSMFSLRGFTITMWGISETISIIENFHRAGKGDLIPEFLRNKVKEIAEQKGVKFDDKS